MKSIYAVKFRHGIAGEATVAASSLDEAVREGMAYARLVTSCIPDEYSPADVVESVRQAEEPNPGMLGVCARPTVQLERSDGFVRDMAKDVLALMSAPSFSHAAPPASAV